MKNWKRLLLLLSITIGLASATSAHAWFKLYQDGVFMGIWDPFDNPEYEGVIQFDQIDLR